MLYILPYWCNPPFLIFDIRALWRSGLSARAPECQKLTMVGYTSMALNPSNGSNLEQLALKGLTTHSRFAVTLPVFHFFSFSLVTSWSCQQYSMLYPIYSSSSSLRCSIRPHRFSQPWHFLDQTHHYLHWTRSLYCTHMWTLLVSFSSFYIWPIFHSENITSRFLSLHSSSNLTQRVHFPTNIHNHSWLSRDFILCLSITFCLVDPLHKSVNSALHPSGSLFGWGKATKSLLPGGR